ncbi:hypothetical protein Tco_0646890 [Tanacetum coccineum]
MLLNTSLIFKLFREKFEKLICHFTEIINLKLLVQHILVWQSKYCSGGLSIRTVSAVCVISTECASSDTRPPILDRTDFESWQQHIRLYCPRKDNGVNILKSIDEERDRVFADLTPEEKERFKADIRATNILLQGSELTKDECESQLYDDFEHFRQNKGETIYEYYVRFTKLINDMRNIKMTMPKMQLNSKFVNSMLPEWGRFMTAQHEAHANESKMMLERYTKHAINPLALVSNVSPHQYPSQSSTNPQSAYVPPGRQKRGQGNYARGAVTSGNGGAQNRVGNTNPGQAKQIKCYNCNGENGVILDEEKLLFIAGGQTNTFDDDVDEAPVQDLALNEDNVFQADQCDAFDSDVDEAPTVQTMFMANLSSADLIYDEADAEYMSDSNIILYEQYVKDNAMQVVQSNVSSVPNDVLMMIINDMHEQSAQCVIENEQNKVVNELLIAELARYKEQVELYEKRAKFELTAREQKVDEQMRIII